MAKKRTSNGNGANLGFEEKLWAAADKLRGHMDAAEYKHVVLGLVFLKYISDAFQELHDSLAADKHAGLSSKSTRSPGTSTRSPAKNATSGN
jgi:type I restriction enzyme M protein